MKITLKNLALSMNIILFLFSGFLAIQGFIRIMKAFTYRQDIKPLTFWRDILSGTAAMLPLTMLIGLFFCG